jgi:hypothetical protein
VDIKEIWFHYMDRIEVDQGRSMWRGSCDHGNKTSGSIKAGEFLNLLIDYHLKEDYAPCRKSR